MVTKRIALVTGASSGIGRDIARNLSRRGFRVILSARRENRLLELKEELVNAEIITADLTKQEECFRLYEEVKDKNICILVNCAGFGALGEFAETDLDNELDMIDLNVKSVHILTKLFLKGFKEKDKGFILNVSSSAGLMPSGPYMSAYYATKAYITSLTTSIAHELKEQGSRVYVGALCPGPVDTEFNEVAGVNFGVKSISSEYCADYAVKKMFERKTIIVPSLSMKAGVVAQRFVPRSVMSKITSEIQKKKLD
ncbi:MAG: SDR family oxidoreductase [Ruminococcus sp.]|nr:SDR family oxidoreductase [Ruminococcus sp.]